MANPQVGVLLPVRLETVFDPPVFDPPDEARANWRLLLLIAPDEASINRHDPGVTRGELDTLEDLWRATGGDLASESAGDAFRQMAERHGAARSLWLARTFPPLLDEQGRLVPDAGGHVIDRGAAEARLRDRPRPGTIEGLPERLEVWMALDDGSGNVSLSQIGDTPIDHGLLNAELDRADPEAAWWTSWEAAKLSGLGLEIDLPMTEEDELHRIEALIVVGIGDEEPNGLFAGHRDSGALAIMEPGAPTNTVAGTPAADLGRDPETWRRLWFEPATASGGDLGLALTGDPDALAPLPGGDAEHRRLNRSLIRVLWPALWGHALKDIWGAGYDTHGIGLWAGDHLCPEGPLAPIRIGNQPYGVLPASSLEQWKAAPDDLGEWPMRECFIPLREELARGARGAGTIVGADTERSLDILGRVPSSSQYAHRLFKPLELLYLVAHFQGSGADFREFVEFWEDHVLSRARQYIPIEPVRRYTAGGYPQDLDLPLVHPADDPGYFYDRLRFLLEIGEQGRAYNVMNALRPRDEPPRLPNSLLLRLIVFSWLVGDAEWKRALLGYRGPLIEPLFNTERTLLERWVDRDEPSYEFDEVLEGSVPGAETVQFELFRRSLQGAYEMLNFAPDEIERALRAVLDTASMRVDPWITGIVHQRLEKLQLDGAATGLGVYGWVDRPYTGRRGPTEGGLLHAPSDAQARAAVILRDKAINDPEADRWKMDLDSTSVRLAKQFADEVRAGSHIQEVLGRAVERAVGDREKIKDLRDRYRIREEHAGRRTCDGQKVLEADEADLGLNAAQVRRLKPLRRIVDGYADLLVAEGVFDVVTGRPEAAGAAMDAAAGLALPPELELLRTPHQGRSANTVVMLALRDKAGPPTTDVGISPGELANPALAAWLADETLADGTWAYQVTRDGVAVPPVTLEQMGLVPVDTLALTEDALALLAVRAARDDNDDQSDWRLDREASATKDALARHERVRRMAALASGGPVQPRDIIRVERRLQDPSEDDRSEDQGIAEGLRDRMDRLMKAAETLSDALENADDAAHRAAVAAAFRWGIAPTAGDEVDVADASYRERARQLLDARRADVPDDPDALTIRQLAEAISALAGAGRVPVFGSMSRATFKGVLADPDSFGPDPALDRDWLEIVAAVRAPLARVESHQIEAARDDHTPLRALTNRPGDPWQKDVPATPTGVPEPSTLVAVYEARNAMDGAGDNGKVALALLDSWSETIPEDRYASTAAFGYNAPASRPPQAILIAVPPVEVEPLDTPTLAQIVLETRELAHARMARLEDVPELAGVLPTAMLPTAPHAGVDLGISEE